MVPGRNGPCITSVTLIGWVHGICYCICEYTWDAKGIKMGVETLIKGGLYRTIQDEVKLSLWFFLICWLSCWCNIVHCVQWSRSLISLVHAASQCIMNDQKPTYCFKRECVAAFPLVMRSVSRTMWSLLCPCPWVSTQAASLPCTSSSYMNIE